MANKAREQRANPSYTRSRNRYARSKGGLRDPLTRAMKRMKLETRERDDARVERAAW